MKRFRMRKRPLLVMLALVFAVQTAAAAMCISMPAAHAAEMAMDHCHATGEMAMAAPMHADKAPHACIHCDAPDLGTPDMPPQMSIPAMALLAFVLLPQPEATIRGKPLPIDSHAQAPPDPYPLYLTTQRIRI